MFVLDPLSDRLGLLVYENVHYAIRKINIDGLNDIEEAVARFYEVLAEIEVGDSFAPIGKLTQKLKR